MAKIVPTSPFVPIFDQPILVNVNGESASGLTGADHCKPLSQQSNILQAEGHQPSLNDFPKAPPSQVAADYILTQMKHINPPDNQVAGRLKYFVDNWKIITLGKTILETVQGYQIPFILRPHQWRKRITKPKLSEGNMFLEAIDDLLAKGAIKETLPVQDKFLSTVFLVKQSTKTRPIFSLKSLNQFIKKEKFKLEGLDQVKTMIQPNDYFMKLDLTDAYYSVPITNSHRKYLHFQLGNRLFEYQCLPFGLTSAPRAFTKLLKPVMSLLCLSGLRVVIYFDDLLILHQNRAELRHQFQLVMTLLMNLGFQIKLEKCSSAPTQVIVFLGACLNSTNMSVSVPQEKFNLLQSECQNILKARHCSVLQLAALLGRLNHATLIGIWKGPLYYRTLQCQYITGVTRTGCFEASKNCQLALNKQALQELEWWSSTQLVQHNQMSLILPPFDMTIWTDASKKGWGAAYLDRKTGGQWAMDEEKAHINVLELKAAYLAIQSFVKDMKSLPRHILLLMDNFTAVCYVNKRGGTRSPQLVSLATEIWNFCLGRNIWITAEHVPGVENVDADCASRQFHNHTEWTLDRKIFQHITQRYYRPEVDLFASRINNQLPKYIARYPDPGSIATDTFLQNWNKWTLFIHPVVLLPRILQKIRNDQATSLLIAPAWKGQPWYPVLLELLTDYPTLLPMTERTIYLPFDPQTTHPLWRTLRLAVWALSGVACKQQAFRMKCAKSCSPHGDRPHRNVMKDHGSSGLAGVCNGTWIHFQHLS